MLSNFKSSVARCIKTKKGASLVDAPLYNFSSS